jgi:hypothetical protein
VPTRKALTTLSDRLQPALLTDLEPQIPWWTLPTTCIHTDANLAIKAHHETAQRDTTALPIYADGSHINQKAGAAAIAPSIYARRMVYLGRDTAYTIFTAELQSIRMALEITTTQTTTNKCIYTPRAKQPSAD